MRCGFKNIVISVSVLTVTTVILHYLIIWEQDPIAWDLPLIEDPYKLLKTPEVLPDVGPHKIPKIIHQIWIDERIPAKLVPWVRSWVENHPSWEYYLWTDVSARSFIATKYPNFLRVYDGYTRAIRRADALRYLILYEYGGVYADLDMESLKPIDQLTFKYNCFVAQEPYEHPAIDGHFRHLAMNALMACSKHHPFMKFVIDMLPDFAHMWYVLDSTGPHFLTYAYNVYTRTRSPHSNDTVYLAPPPYFLPTLDPVKFKDFRRECWKYPDIPDVVKDACLALKSYGFKRKPLPYTLTIHHWIHTYFQNNFSYKSPVSIYDIVSRVFIYKNTMHKHRV